MNIVRCLAFTAAFASTLLTFGFRNDRSFFALDDISVAQIQGANVPDGASTMGHCGVAVVGLSVLRRARILYR
jgi:hypothetical protein